MNSTEQGGGGNSAAFPASLRRSDTEDMNNEWPSLSEFQATIGRLATDEDIRKGRAAFLLQSDGERIGNPIPIDLPARAWYVDNKTSERKRCIIIQAEETGESRYYGAWLIDSNEPFVGFDSDFEILSDHGT